MLRRVDKSVTISHKLFAFWTCGVGGEFVPGSSNDESIALMTRKRSQLHISIRALKAVAHVETGSERRHRKAAVLDGGANVARHERSKSEERDSARARSNFPASEPRSLLLAIGGLPSLLLVGVYEGLTPLSERSFVVSILRCTLLHRLPPSSGQQVWLWRLPQILIFDLTRRDVNKTSIYMKTTLLCCETT